MALVAFVNHAVALSGTNPTVVDNITAQINPIITMMMDIMTTLLGNPFFCFLFGCGFVRIGMSLIKKAKKTAR